MDGDRSGRVVQDGAVLDLPPRDEEMDLSTVDAEPTLERVDPRLLEEPRDPHVVDVPERVHVAPAQVDVERITGVGHEEQRSGPVSGGDATIAGMLTVHRAERADTLVEVLVATMGSPAARPKWPPRS